MRKDMPDRLLDGSYPVEGKVSFEKKGERCERT
jgi:hypothetical protein